MKDNKHTAEQIVAKLREAEVLSAKDTALVEVRRRLESTDTSYYGQRKEYGGLGVDQAKRLEELSRKTCG